MHSRSLRRSLTALGLGAALVAVATAPATAAPPRPGAPLVVQTDAGALQGERRDGVRLFQGIPYAAPPVGDLRFRPPQPVEPWDGVRDATGPGNQCAQLVRLGNRQSFGEDCLYLNVTTPAGISAKRARLPVMVWVHGGSFVYGNGANYDASKLAVQGDVVVVTINYRLGPLGFLAQQALSQQNGDVGSGTAALLDQQAALRWVRENIAGFGGDPRRVTLFGESAGASAVCAQLVSPSAQGLFDRAIPQSYSCAAPYETLAQAEAKGARVAAAVGCTDPATVAECLRTEGDAFVEALLRAWGAQGGGAFVVGGAALPLQPTQAIAADRYAHVPVMHGNNRDENTLFTPLGPPARSAATYTEEQYVATLQQRYGARAGEVLARYPASAYSSPLRALSAIDSDAGGRLSTCDHVDAYEALREPPRPTRVFAYQFRDRTASPLVDHPGLDEGAQHAAELPFLFPGLFGAPLTAEQEALSDAMVAYWTNFAARGNPNGRGVPAWRPYTDPSDVQGLDRASAGGIGPVDVAAEANCDFWSTF